MLWYKYRIAVYAQIHANNREWTQKTKKPRGKTRKTARKKERNQEDEKYKFIIL